MLTHLRVKPGDVESIPDLNRGAMGNGERLGLNGHGFFVRNSEEPG